MNKRPILIFFLLTAIFILPIGAAHWLYKYGRYSLMIHSVHYGTLVQPPLDIHHLTLLAPVLMNGKESLIKRSFFKLTQANQTKMRAWLLLYINTKSTCLEVCKKQLYFMKQLQLALGKDRDRLENWLITVNENALPLEVSQLKKRLNINYGKTLPQMLKSFFRQEQFNQVNGFYVVDPLGNLMMAYPPDENPNHILKDLKRLLKVSRIG